MTPPRVLLGELLVGKKLITQDQLDIALRDQKLTREFLGSILVKRGYVKEEDLLKALADQFQIPYIRLTEQYIDWNAAMKFSSNFVTTRKVLPVKEDDKGITVAITNPLDAIAVSEAEKEARGEKVNLILVSSGDMAAALRQYQERVAARIKKLLE